MATEHVVKMKDAELGEVQLDIENGYVYDLNGNQIARWGVTDNKHSKALADFAADEALAVLCGAVRSGIHFGPGAEQRSRDDHERSRAIRMRGWENDSSGMVKMAGELGTADVHLPSALPNYAAGYKNEQPVADMYAPPVLVPKPSDKYFTFAKEDAFQRANPTAGATAGAVPEIAPRLANATFTTLERALGGFVGTQLEAAADAALRIRQATMTRVLNALVLERELRVATLATTSTTWDSTVYTSLAAGAKWNGGATSDPVKDIQDKMETAWGTPNALLFSRRVFHAFQRNAAVQKYFAYKSSTSPLPGPAEMSALLQLPPIYVADMRYVKSDGTLDYIWGNAAVLCRVPPQMPPSSQDDISSATTFRWNGQGATDGQASNGMIVREFFLQDRGSLGGNKVVLVHQDAEVQTSKFLGGLIAGAFQ